MLAQKLSNFRAAQVVNSDIQADKESFLQWPPCKAQAAKTNAGAPRVVSVEPQVVEIV
jgi:hypothetical protein